MTNGAPIEIQFSLRAIPSREIGGSDTSRPSSGRLPQITRVLALAIHFDDMISKGDAKDYADIARLSCVCRERVSQVMRLNYLAPDIQVELLYLPPVPAGRTRSARLQRARLRISSPGKSNGERGRLSSANTISACERC
jgi:hypothetical protein